MGLCIPQYAIPIRRQGGGRCFRLPQLQDYPYLRTDILGTTLKVSTNGRRIAEQHVGCAALQPPDATYVRTLPMSEM